MTLKWKHQYNFFFFFKKKNEQKFLYAALISQPNDQHDLLWQHVLLMSNPYFQGS